MTSCSLVEVYLLFRRNLLSPKFALILYKAVPPKREHTSTRLHGVTSLQVAIFIVTVVRTASITQPFLTL